MRGEPGQVEVKGWDGVLDYCALKAQERGGGHVPRVVVLIIGEVEDVSLYTEKRRGCVMGVA